VSELRELQRAFAAAVLDGHPGEIAPRIRARGLDGAERVQIYCNNARVSLTQALADVFPVIERLVGDAFFAQLARTFLRAHPSRSGNLHGLGREMALFLCGLPEARALPYLADVAAGRYKNILVSALGINKKPKVEIGEDASLRTGDIFLLSSDGLWAYFEDEELVEILHQLPPREASEQLVSLARERGEGRGDNMSLAIIKLEPQPRAGHARRG